MEVPHTLSKREWQVLQAMVKAYVALGAPIGSRTLLEQENLGISPATIRSTLARLEQKGFVKQPHTSAGRIPADKAYRFYVKECIGDHTFEDSVEVERLKGSIEAKLQEGNLDVIMAQLAKVVGEVSRQLGFAMAPRFESGVFHKLELVQPAERRLLMVVTINQGLVRSMDLEVDSEASRNDVQILSRLLNERLAGLSMSEIRSSAQARLSSATVGNPQLLRVVTREIVELAQPAWGDLHVSGAGNMCLQPEFSDPSRIAGLIDLVERRDELAQLLQGRQGMVITIGEDHAPREMRACSMVTASYEVDGIARRAGCYRSYPDALRTRRVTRKLRGTARVAAR